MDNKELYSGHLGNGLAVWYKGTDTVVAHIAHDRSVKYYLDDLSDKHKQEIELLAKTDDRNISVTQDQKVFINRPNKT
jgi:hypothetical protein